MSVRFLVPFPLFACLLASAGLAADAGPQAFAPEIRDIGHFAAIWKRSPFITETVAVQVTAGLATKYSFVGSASIAGQPIVFLVDRNNGDPAKNRLLVSKAKPSAEGIELVSVAIETDPRKSSAVIRQGGQQTTLPFDSTAMGPTGPNSQPGAVPPPPSALVPGMNNGGSALPGLIPPPKMANPGGVNPPTSPRRIIRPAPIDVSN